MENHKTILFFHPLGCVPSYPAKTKGKGNKKTMKNHKAICFNGSKL